MRSTYKSNLGHLAKVQNYWVQQRDLSFKDRVQSKLTHLQVFIQQLEQEPSGKAELQCRVELFGDCKQMPDETTAQFYSRIRRWLDRDIEG